MSDLTEGELYLKIAKQALEQEYRDNKSRSLKCAIVSIDEALDSLGNVKVKIARKGKLK